MSRIVVAGALAQKPAYPGHAWMFVQWLLGLRRLGFDVLFIDRMTDDMGSVEAGRAFLDAVMAQFGLADDYLLLGRGSQCISGTGRAEAIARTKGSLLINVNGFLNDQELLGVANHRVYLDIDPGFGQMWRELGLHDPFTGHDSFVTLAENIGKAECRVPTCGLEWITTRQPVVLDLWPARRPTDEGAFTSIGSWRGPFAPVHFGGDTFGLRVHEFRRFVDLPRLTGREFELALDIHHTETSDREVLLGSGWRLLEPHLVACDLDGYREFIRHSRAEFMVAKNMYVATRGAWFSERSACYLATGRPVIAEDTGLSGLYPLGEGLIAFQTLEEAADAVESVCAKYVRHAEAAHEIAEAYFDSDKVLTALLDHLASAVA